MVSGIAKPAKMTNVIRIGEVFHPMPQGDTAELKENASNPALILVVEDDQRTLRLERFVLEDEGFTIVSAGSGEEALKMLPQISPTLILLDIGLPGMDGFTTCQRIRESSQVPVIMVTAEDRDEDKVKGLEMGADDYVTKPFSTTELAARVKAVIRRYRMVLSVGGISPPNPEVPKQEEHSEIRTAPRAPEVQAPEPGNEDIFEGTVRLSVKTTGSIRGMINFVDELRQSQDFHLLRLVADQQKEGMDIWLRLRGPLDLKDTLLQVEGVAKVEVSIKTDPEAEPGEQLLDVSLGA